MAKPTIDDYRNWLRRCLRLPNLTKEQRAIIMFALSRKDESYAPEIRQESKDREL
jgi:hypothetical protein